MRIDLNVNAFPELDTSNESGFCMTFDALCYINDNSADDAPLLYKDFADWERYAEKFLAERGYVKQGGWRTIEGDSFGPLVRGLHLEKEGTLYDFYYG